MRSVAIVCAITVLVWMRPTATQAQLGDCERIGDTAIAHTCGHGENGPYGMMAAAATATASTPSPARHVYTSVALPGTSAPYRGELTWRYPNGGFHALWTLGDVPITVRDFMTGEIIPIALEHEISSCSRYLTHVRLWDIAGITRYRIEIGPTATPEVLLVAENLDDIATPWFPDADGDGFGVDVDEPLLTFCAGPAGSVENDAGDCDDTDPNIHPNRAGDAPETVCDGVDQDCDEIVDDGFDLGTECFEGLGACRVMGATTCSDNGTATVCSATPGTPSDETCNGSDDDCNGMTDDGASICAMDAAGRVCRQAGTTGASCGCASPSDCAMGADCDTSAGRCVIVDAGQPMDGGTPDAASGSGYDSSVAAQDSGTSSQDSGAPVPLDAGRSVDSGALVLDASPYDANTSPDASTPDTRDAMVGFDAGSPDAAPSGPSAPSCGCRVGGRPAHSPFAMFCALALIALAIGRRRRAR